MQFTGEKEHEKEENMVKKGLVRTRIELVTSSV
jgi:hypothetical protein